MKSWSQASQAAAQSKRTETPFPYQRVLLDHSLWYHGDVAVSNNDLYYMLVSFGVSALISLFGTLKSLWIFVGSVRASRVLFSRMTSAVLNASMMWLDTVPTGRMLNRFVSDFEIVDSSLPNDIIQFIYYALQLVGIIITGAFVSLYSLVCAVPLLSICMTYARQYMAGARDVKRLGKRSYSPGSNSISEPSFQRA